ncbi:MAG: hypothetical protein ABW224_05865 [Kibdelosporangium sp.]
MDDRDGSAEQPAAPAPRSEELSTRKDDRTGPPKQGGSPSGNAGGAGSTPSGCKADRELAAALAGELPAAATPTEVTVPFGCPPGAVGASYLVADGARRGTVSVVVVPSGVEPGIAPMGGDVAGYSSAQSPATSGASVYVVSQPAPGTGDAPLTNDIPRYASAIGKRF